MELTLQSALAGASAGAAIGAIYGILAAERPAYREHDAIHYGLAVGAIGAIAGIFWAKPSAAPTLTPIPTSG
jgi:hypothetical protein